MPSQNRSNLIHLPARATSRDGVEWIPHEDSWTMPTPSAVLHFCFGRLRPTLTKQVLDSLKYVLTNYLEKYSPTYSFNLFKLACELFEAIHQEGSVGLITSQAILLYRGGLTKRTEWHLASLRAMFKTWDTLSLPGLAPDVIPLLRQMRLKGNEKGVAVLTADPKKGLLTDLEFQAVTAALNDRFAKGDITLGDYLLVWLFLAIGARPVQIAMLKVSDFSVTRASNGATLQHQAGLVKAVTNAT
jgi:hypothetical protein